MALAARAPAVALRGVRPAGSRVVVVRASEVRGSGGPVAPGGGPRERVGGRGAGLPQRGASRRHWPAGAPIMREHAPAGAGAAIGLARCSDLVGPGARRPLRGAWRAARGLRVLRGARTPGCRRGGGQRGQPQPAVARALRRAARARRAARSGAPGPRRPPAPRPDAAAPPPLPLFPGASPRRRGRDGRRGARDRARACGRAVRRLRARARARGARRRVQVGDRRERAPHLHPRAPPLDVRAHGPHGRRARGRRGPRHRARRRRRRRGRAARRLRPRRPGHGHLPLGGRQLRRRVHSRLWPPDRGLPGAPPAAVDDHAARVLQQPAPGAWRCDRARVVWPPRRFEFDLVDPEGFSQLAVSRWR
jgi:hypothetical protein